MGVAVYTPEQKVIAKSLAVAYGSAEQAHEHLVAVWGAAAEEAGMPGLAPPAVPSVESIRVWKRDSSIPLDQELIDEYLQMARQFTVGSANRIVEKAEGVLLAAMDGNDSKAALDYAKVWGIAADKMNGRFGNVGVPVGGVQFNGPTFLTYAPAALPQPQGSAPGSGTVVESGFVDKSED